MKPLHIFRAGRHTASCGTTLDFDETALQGAVDAYDPALHEAPIVIGHPRDNGPAFGWIRGLSYAEGDLSAEPHQVNDDFAELVKPGAYKKISASFYSPDAPTNPAPGAWYLRHVGFLGAQPPAIKGLAAIGFNDAEEGVVEFGGRDAGPANDLITAGVMRRLREWLLQKYGREDADDVVPAYLVEDMEHVARTPEPEPATPEYAEEPDMTPEELQAAQERLAADQAKLAADQAKLTDNQTAFAEREQRIAATEAAQRIAGINEQVEGLVRQGKILPAEKGRIAAFMASLTDDQVVEFSEDGKAQQAPAGQLLINILNSLPARVDFNERAVGGQADLDDAVNVDQLAVQAVAYQEAQRAKGIELSTSAAVAAVQAGQQ